MNCSKERVVFWYKGTDPKIIKDKIKASIKWVIDWKRKFVQEKTFFDPKNKTLKN